MCSLNTYITTKMKMTAIYQPVIIRCILQGKTSLLEIAQELSTLLHGNTDNTCKYLKALKVHPNKVLTSHGIATIVPRSGHFTLLTKDFNASICYLSCNDKIDKFLSK